MAHNGNDLIISVGGVAIAASKTCKVSVQANTNKVASPSNGQWEYSQAGRKAWIASTDHIVTSLSRAAVQVGTTVDIQVALRGSQAKEFQGFVDYAPITPGTYTGPYIFIKGILWNKTNKCFIIEVENLSGMIAYYTLWTDSTPYTSPSAYDTFKCDGVVYSWLDGDLMSEKLTGRAIVKTWDVQGSRGNIMMGSFSFKGTGPLAPASLPT